ncbi:MAG: 6-phosphogluconolactonase [Pyrinomonadaceae bacterium]
MTLEAGIQVSANAQELSRSAAEQFVRLAIEAEREKGLFTVALAGGSTPKNLYALLANGNELYRAQLCWEKIHFFWGDERHVPPDHPDSNYRMANEAMLARVPVPLENVHRIKSELADAGKAAAEYEHTLREFFRLAAGQTPRFDLILLGMGPDGHTASIFPNSDVINEKSRLVVAPWIEKFKSYRITLTPPVLNNAAAVIFLVSGAEKAKVLREVLEGNYQPELFPVQLIRPSLGNVLWLVDREAARLLSEKK